MLAFITFSLLSLVSLAAAIPNNPTVTVTVTATAPGATVTQPADVCSTGSIQCCQSTEKANSAAGSAFLGLLGIVLKDTNVLIGLDCSPITVVGVGSGNSCSASTVCCENNNVGGLISVGCVPVSL
ncbi:fungal hydrophobin [Lentinus tigrinus ALCF2SS1-7]|uniref:Hydrophobin n=1 Tax=Lentinus tigrinus ALCF2SS1-6 TaxID=1328759 RepID=A0A5C2SR17_9APHY|nr:fungal hydrophobin [Lentinus tigrinus ALCF2SS1-6]RPD79071.1 fungal hydrophobin [Lentinus tigrinus ALCF2SS1-7]